MPIDEFSLKLLLEEEERETVSSSFGAPKSQGRTKSFSVAKIRNCLLEQGLDNTTQLAKALTKAKNCLPSNLYSKILNNLIRFSFLIELTNLTVGSTKMKTRWLPGFILMPQEGSFEPIKGSFQPGNDPRSSSFEECCRIFVNCLDIISNKVKSDNTVIDLLSKLAANTSVPYEFVFDYIDPTLLQVHVSNNIRWVLNDDILWLIKARSIIWPSLLKQQKDKIQTKTYKTDRALTGKDKTNRAKRWEVLSGDFQHASLTHCWSVERKLLTELINFEGFPSDIRDILCAEKLVDSFEMSRCPVTLEPLLFSVLLSPAVHGQSDYQVGHLHPLKRAGLHKGDNVCWQSSDGNRIQGNLTIEETVELLDSIMERKKQLEG